MTTIYRSTDASAPAMTSSSGSLIDVLNACLVTGYGAKAAAGWTKEVIDAATFQATFTQGAVSGLVGRKLYVKDNNTYPGNATCWACTSCTVAASPVLTENFWDYNTTSIGILVKADQETAGTARWIIVANARSVVLLTKRSGWGLKGWAFTFFGDLDSGLDSDKGKFSVVGFNLSQGGSLIPGAAPRDWCNNRVGVYGNQDGTFEHTSYTLRKTIGSNSAIADTVSPRSRYSYGLQISRALVADTARLRGTVPFIWLPVANPASLSWYALPDELLIATSDGSKHYQYIQFDSVLQSKLFLETAEFTS